MNEELLAKAVEIRDEKKENQNCLDSARLLGIYGKVSALYSNRVL